MSELGLGWPFWLAALDSCEDVAAVTSKITARYLPTDPAESTESEIRFFAWSMSEPGAPDAGVETLWRSLRTRRAAIRELAWSRQWEDYGGTAPEPMDMDRPERLGSDDDSQAGPIDFWPGWTPNDPASPPGQSEAAVRHWSGGLANDGRRGDDPAGDHPAGTRSRTTDATVVLDAAANAAAGQFNVNLADLKDAGQTRREISRARHVAIVLARSIEPRIDDHEIARYFGYGSMGAVTSAARSLAQRRRGARSLHGRILAALDSALRELDIAAERAAIRVRLGRLIA